MTTSAPAPAPRLLVIRPRSAFSVEELGDIWRHRELLVTLGLRDVSVRYKQATLGVAWALVQPVLQMLIFTFLFGRVAGMRADGAEPYSLFVLAGLAVWLLFANGLTAASESLVANSNLVTKVYFPRAVIPLAALASSVVDFFFGFILLLVLMRYYGVPFHASLILAPLVALLSVSAAAALGLWTSALNLRFRDVRYALPFFIQILIYTAPVVYAASALPARWQFLLRCNPMAPVVESFRAAVFGQSIPWISLSLATLAILVVGAGGFYWFRSVERSFADRV
jgi:lipopolysaccharide transport system permease protein